MTKVRDYMRKLDEDPRSLGHVVTRCTYGVLDQTKNALAVLRRYQITLLGDRWPDSKDFLTRDSFIRGLLDRSKNNMNVLR